jgi:hypothetical protein
MMVERFGAPHQIQGEPGEGLGQREYWAYRFPCGLVAVIVFYLESPNGPDASVCANAAEVNHLLHHLPIGDSAFWRLDRDGSDFYLARYGRPDRFSLIRQDDNGNRVEISTHPTERAAQCIQRHLESTAHKQTYWVEENR